VRPEGLAGRPIEFPGLQFTITDALVRYELLDGCTGTAIVHPSQPWLELPKAPTHWAVAKTYLWLWPAIGLHVVLTALLALAWRSRRREGAKDGRVKDGDGV
jgi:hypothetical protein